jgi:hypothetical protein
MSKPVPVSTNDKADGVMRMLAVAFRRYSREPETRPLSSRMLLLSALALHAEETSAGEAALVAAEGVANLGIASRARGER